jgi:hypothetical protein
MQRLQYPFPVFFDQAGALLDAGKVYIGTSKADPETSPITVYFDIAGTIPATQPIRTRGGVPVNDSGAPTIIYVSATDYSMRVRDAAGNQISYAATTTDIAAVAFQPFADALATLATTDPSTIGLQLLQAADATAIKTLLGIVASVAATGGTVSGNIVRQGAGVHIYHNDPALTSGRIFITAVGAADPTTLPGDIWLQVA